MTDKENRKHVVQTIIQAAKIYKSKLVGKTFMYVFDNRYIEVIYKKGNFKHLTGVGSEMSAKKFFQDAVNSRLRSTDIFFSDSHPYENAIKKSQFIIDISELAGGESFMLEDISTKTRSYKFGTTNLEFSLLLNKPTDKENNPVGDYYIPESFRIEDCFSKSQNQFIITHIFCNQISNSLDKKYDTLVYMDKNSNIENLPENIKKMISNDFFSTGGILKDAKCPSSEEMAKYKRTNEKCNAILNANPELKGKLNLATVEYCRKHNLDLPDSSLPADKRYEMRNEILNENPILKAEYIKAKNAFEQKQGHTQSNNPKPKLHR